MDERGLCALHDGEAVSVSGFEEPMDPADRPQRSEEGELVGSPGGLCPAVPDREAKVARYREFLSAKAELAPSMGFDCDPSEVNPILKPFQRDIVAWALRVLAGERSSQRLGLARPLCSWKRFESSPKRLVESD